METLKGVSLHLSRRMTCYLYYQHICMVFIYSCPLCISTDNRIWSKAQRKALIMIDEWRGITVMEVWSNKRKKHAIVYLLVAPLVFGAQLAQEEQINYPHRNQKTERQEYDWCPVSSSLPTLNRAFQISFTSLFVRKRQVQVNISPSTLKEKTKTDVALKSR